MQTIKLPIVMAVVLLAAIAGGVVSYVFFPSADPEMKALLQRQVELAEQEAAERERAAQATREFFDADSDQARSVRDQFRSTDSKPFEPEW